MYNFSAGPAVLPAEVLAQIQAELTSWRGSGMSVMEMSHRGPEFATILEEAEQDLRVLLQIPKNYRVLFMQGGGRAQFAAVPLNLLPMAGRADYLITGYWSAGAYQEALRWGDIRQVASGESLAFRSVPPQMQWKTSTDAAYFHYCANETVHGIELQEIPVCQAVPLVVDASSNILSQPLAVERFGVIYAGAQKNIGPAGLTLVIIREDLLDHARADMPSVLNYTLMAEQRSLWNTPPTFAIYVAGLVFKWLQEQGGLAAMAKYNAEKSGLLYAWLDQNRLFSCLVDRQYRSRMNVCFTAEDPKIDEAFLAFAKERNLLQLKGHKAVGGIRASLYNAMPLAGVKTLVDCLAQFEDHCGLN